jgi:nucleotide-binding universal stress UspA family protein
MPRINQTGPRLSPIAENRFQHVMVCLDRSARAEAALPMAAYLARIYNARMTLMSVMAPPVEDGDARATHVLDWEIVRQEVRSYLDRWTQKMSDYGIETEPTLEEGPTAQRVAEHISAQHVDLLVLTSRGENESDIWTLGGTAHKILSLSNVPTLVVPSGPDEPVSHTPPRKIFVPLDGSVRSECVLPIATHIARASNSEIVVSHVVNKPVRTELLFDDEDFLLARQIADRLASRAEEYLGRVVAHLEAGGVDARSVITQSPEAKQELVALCSAESADLIVLSAHGTTCNARTDVGSVASYIVARSSTPILIVRDLQTSGHAKRRGGEWGDNQARFSWGANDGTAQR